MRRSGGGLLFLLLCAGGAWGLPSVVWWTELLFPHPGEGQEIACPGGGRCLSRRRGGGPLGGEGEATAFLFYGTDFKGDDLPLPRREGDLWSLLHEESPMNNFVLVHAVSLFNLTATFSRHAHFPLPTLHLPSLPYLTRRPPLPTPDKNRLRQQGLAPVLYLQSHCGVSSDRDRYVRRLMRFLPVDSYGGCLRNAPLPLHLRTTDTHHSPLLMDFIARYKFHLAFENAVCEDYVTEKLFRALHVGSVPVYRGSPSVLDWAPSPASVVVADHFRGPEELARLLLELDADDARYDALLAWKGEGGVSNALLRETLGDRAWRVDDPTDAGQVHDPASMDFVRGFECYVCDQLCSKIPRPPPPDQRHMNCPPPHPSLPPGDLEDFQEEEVDSCRLEDEGSCPLLAEGPLTDGHAFMRWSVDDWLRDYRFASRQAEAVARVLRDGGSFLHHLDALSTGAA